MDRKSHTHRHGIAHALGIVGFAVCFVFLALTPCAWAQEETDLAKILEEALQEVDTQAWESMLSLTRQELLEKLQRLLQGEWNFESFWEEFFRLPLQQSLKENAGTAATLMILGLLSGLMPHVIRDSGSAGILCRVLGAACAASLGSVMLVTLRLCFDTLMQLLTFLEGAQSVMTALAVTLGAQQSMGVLAATGSFFFSLFTRFFSEVLFPAWMMIVFLQLTGLFVEDPLPGRIGNTLSRVTQWILGLGCGVAVVVMKSQLGFATAADSLTRRTLRSTVEQGFPVVGGYLRDMVDTTLLSADLLQNGLGSLSILAVAWVVVPLCIQLGIAYAALQLGSLGAGENPLGDKLRSLSMIFLLCMGALVLCAFWVVFCLGQIVSCGTQILYA